MKHHGADVRGRALAHASGVMGDRIGRLPSSDAAARKADSDPPGLRAGRRCLASG